MLLRIVICAAVLVSLLPSIKAQQPAQRDDASFDTLLHHAFDFHQKNEYGQALPLLRSAWKLQPRDYFVNLLLGIDLLRTGRRVESLTFLKQAARANPKEETPYEYLGEAQAALGRYAEAFQAYARAVQLAPQSPDTTVPTVDFCLARYVDLAARLRTSQAGLAAEYRLQARSRPVNDPERRSLLVHAASLDGNAPGIWSELALTELANGDVTAARQHLQLGQEHDRNDLRSWEAEALLAGTEENWDLAIARLEAIYTHSPRFLARAVADWPSTLRPPDALQKSGPGAAFLKCVREKACTAEDLLDQFHVQNNGEDNKAASSAALFREQRWDSVVSRPEPALSEAEAWFYRGTAFAELDDCDRAIPALERGFASHLRPTENMFLLSVCYARQAGAVASRLQESGGDDAPLHMMRGDILLRLHADSSGALAEYQSAQAGHGNDPDILQRLAEAQLGAGQIDLARESAESALRLDPRRLSAIRTIAKIAMQERNYSQALPYLRQLVERSPHDMTVRIELGTACAQTGALEEALKNLGPALQSGYPDEKGSLHYVLGTVLRRMGRTGPADQAFAAATRLSNDFQHNSRQEQHEQP